MCSTRSGYRSVYDSHRAKRTDIGLLVVCLRALTKTTARVVRPPWTEKECDRKSISSQFVCPGWEDESCLGLESSTCTKVRALNNNHVILIFTGHVFPLILLFLPPPPGA